MRDGQVGVRLEAVDQLGRDRVAAADLDVAGFERRGEGLGVEDRDDDDLVELRPLGVVVVLEALQRHALAELVLGHLEGAGADGLEAVVGLAHRLERALADDGHGAARGAFQRLDQQAGLRRAEDDLDLVVAELLDVLDVLDDAAVDRLLRVARALPREDHVVRRERVAVVEGDALAQVEGVLGAVAVDLPVLGEIALGDQLRVDMGQAAEHVRRDLEQQHLVDLGGVDGAELADARPAGAERAAGLALRLRLADPDAGHQVRRGQRARCRQQAQHGSAFQHRAGQVVPVEPDQRVPHVEIVRLVPAGLHVIANSPAARSGCHSRSSVGVGRPTFAPQHARVKSVGADGHAKATHGRSRDPAAR